MTAYWFVLFFLFIYLFLDALHSFKIEKKLMRIENNLLELLNERKNK